MALGAIVFVAVAAIVGYAAISAPPPPQARAVPPPAQPSCPEYLEEEVATFEGSGDRKTRAFEVSGSRGYEYASTGYGTIRMTVLGGEGDAPFDTEGGLTLPATARAAGSTSERHLQATDRR